MSMDMDRFREVLRRSRKERGISQGALSTLTESSGTAPVNPMTISEIETGAITDPRIMTVARIVEAIPGLTLSSFFARIEDLKHERPLDENHAPPNPDEDIDEALAALSPAQIRTTLMAFGKAFAEHARVGEGERRTDRRYVAKNGHRATEEGDDPRDRHPRPAAKRLTKTRKR